MTNTLFFAAMVGLAPPPPASASHAAPAPASVEAQSPEVFAIGEQLRCPVCQGMPIAESPSSMAQDMMQRVRDMHAQGKSREEIFNYFVARYGEWVLLSPRAEGFSLTVWLAPPLALVVGAAIWWWWLRKRTGGPVSPGASAQAPRFSAADEQYLREIRREVEK